MSSVDQLKLVAAILESEGRDAAFADVEWSVRRIAELEAALRKINALIDSPARFNKEVQAVLDSVIDTSDTKFSQ